MRPPFSFIKERNMKISLKKLNSKHLLTVSALVLAFVIGFSMHKNCTVPTPSNIAVVNVKQIVSQSQKLMLIRKENDKKLKELSKWLDGVEKDIGSEKDKQKRQKLASQYKKLAKEKEDLIKQDYNKKIQEIDKEITSLINEVATKENCEVILDKNLVVKGGKDITAQVIKQLNPPQKEKSKTK